MTKKFKVQIIVAMLIVIVMELITIGFLYNERKAKERLQIMETKIELEIPILTGNM